MQNQTANKFVLLAVPTEIIEVARIEPDMLLQFTVTEGRLVIEPVEEAETLICDGACDECPLREEETTLMEFLNNLSEEQQSAALVHLSVLWAQKMAGDTDV